MLASPLTMLMNMKININLVNAKPVEDGTMIEATMGFQVQNAEHLDSIIKNLMKINGVKSVSRLSAFFNDIVNVALRIGRFYADKQKQPSFDFADALSCTPKRVFSARICRLSLSTTVRSRSCWTAKKRFNFAIFSLCLKRRKAA